MSGSSRVDFQSEYYHLSAESACMNFSSGNPPGYEQRWHQNWKAKAETWLAQATPILEQRFTMLAAVPDPDWPVGKYGKQLPVWRSYENLKPEQPCRVEFVGMNGPGMTTITVAFSRLPSEEARERFKQELIKDLAMLDQQGKER